MRMRRLRSAPAHSSESTKSRDRVVLDPGGNMVFTLDEIARDLGVSARVRVTSPTPFESDESSSGSTESARPRLWLDVGNSFRKPLTV
jgi:hypothetical protein